MAGRREEGIEALIAQIPVIPVLTIDRLADAIARHVTQEREVIEAELANVAEHGTAKRG